MKKTFLLFSVLALPGAAQIPFGAGIKLGVPLTETLDTASEISRGYVSETRRFIYGPVFEIRLPAGFAVEFDALYTKMQFSSRNIGLNVLTAVTDANAWEFPLLLKKKFGSAPIVRPFVDVGASWRRITDVRHVASFITGSSQTTSSPEELRRKNATGFVVGAGLEIKLLFIRLTPEARFTRWGTDNFRSGIAGLLDTNRNQGQFLVGISF